jgi:hypothetical protein
MLFRVFCIQFLFASVDDLCKHRSLYVYFPPALCSCHILIGLPLLEKHGRKNVLHCHCLGCCLGFVSFLINDFSTSLSLHALFGVY